MCQHVRFQDLFPFETLFTDCAGKIMVIVITVFENVQAQFPVAPKLSVAELTVKRPAGSSVTAVKVFQHFRFSLSFGVAYATIEAYMLCTVNVHQEFGNLQKLGITDVTGE